MQVFYFHDNGFIGDFLGICDSGEPVEFRKDSSFLKLWPIVRTKLCVPVVQHVARRMNAASRMKSVAAMKPVHTSMTASITQS